MSRWVSSVPKFVFASFRARVRFSTGEKEERKT